ncbi:MAG: zinc ABC transporter substrate-binding protein [Leptolyngbyaceae cyanobacterium bins.349]|nr:zinc ABC transporter substrate-binding protein [Leptolyngbyaceae cyanobacterium bins.349]
MDDSKTVLRPDSGIIRRLSVVLVSAIAVSLGSCASNTPSTSSALQAQSSPVATTDELQVVTTFLPITQFTKAVAGDRAEVTQLLPTNVGPHDFQARPEDAQRLAKADVLVQNGLEMEEFLEDLVKNAGNTNLKVIDSSQGVKTIATEAIAGHDHGHDHGAGEKNAEAKHDHGADNPHIWLDPKRAIQQVENIRDGLITVDPGGKETYTANAAAYIQQLKDLDAETTKLLKPYSGKTFVAFHDFAPYFADSYNLKANFLVDVPEENPSPEDVKRVTTEVKEANLRAILTEPQAGASAFAALAKDLNVQISTFDPIETGGPEAVQPEHYFAVMRQNVQNLVTAFGRSTQAMAALWAPRAIAPVPIAPVPQRVGLRV